MNAAAQYAAIVSEAAYATREAQEQAPADGSITAYAAKDVADKLARKALELSGRLSAIAAQLDMSSFSISVSAFPPGIQISATWETDAQRKTARLIS